MRAFGQRAATLVRARGGLAAIEFAILGPVLVMVLICTADLGLALYHAMQVESAAQAGAEYATVHGFDNTGISNAVTSATSGFSISASPAPTEFCGCPNGTGVTQATCGSTCANGDGAGIYVQVGAAGTYTTVIHYPSLPATFSLASSAVVRVQ